jgi:hypothetical protein
MKSGPGCQSGWEADPYPVHLALLLLVSGAGEGDLEHGREGDGIRVVAAQNKRVLRTLASWLRVREPDASTNRLNLDTADDDLLALADNGLELDNGRVLGNWG